MQQHQHIAIHAPALQSLIARAADCLAFSLQEIEPSLDPDHREAMDEIEKTLRDLQGLHAALEDAVRALSTMQVINSLYRAAAEQADRDRAERN